MFADRGFRQAARRCRVEFVGYPQKPWTLVDVPKREARRGAPGFKDRFRKARQRAGAGDTGGMSLRRARTEPSCINKVPQRKLGTEKRKPRRPCRGFPCRYTFPRLFARISLLTKVVQRGETRATRWHEVQFNWLLLKKYSGCNSHILMGLPSPSQVPPLQEPRSPGVSPIAGASQWSGPKGRA